MNINEITNILLGQNYISNKRIDFAVSASINDNIPLLIEGAPGTGKTALAKAVAEALNLPLLRVQMYEGVDASKVLYDYDYQKQLLTIEAIKSSLEDQLKGKDVEAAMDYVKHIDFYGKEFLIERPVLKSIMGNQKYVLLIDEIDKASEELEYSLLEVLDEFAMSIPQFGNISCPEEMRPIVFITSNNYRDLSEAFKRRCNYLYIQPKTAEEIETILEHKTSANKALQESISRLLVQVSKMDLKQTPSIAEAINWAEYLAKNIDDLKDLPNTLTFIAKNKNDENKIKNCKAFKEFTLE